MAGKLSYGAVGLTRPGEEAWSGRPKGYLWHAATTVVGHGRLCWDEAASAVMDWEVKTRSGFVVESLTNGLRARENADYRLTARFGPFIVHEPVRARSLVAVRGRCRSGCGGRSGTPRPVSADRETWQ
ncbi:DUF1990 family protein [Actinoplanes oblitus]|uniref:DUF1990 family protein n=1 Tax=Actinoplanes oblitus TaxID=3040509 RepID=UPI0038992CA1